MHSSQSDIVCLLAEAISYWLSGLLFLTEDLKAFFFKALVQIFAGIRLPYSAVVVDEYDPKSQLLKS